MIMDEADRLLEHSCTGFTKDLEFILSVVPAKHQAVLFSTTLTTLQHLQCIAMNRPFFWEHKLQYDIHLISAIEEHIRKSTTERLPLSLLKTAQNHPMLVELKNGETYNGHLVSCDNWMNINLREVICTSRDGDKFWRMPECYIRGSTIKYLRIPDEIIDMVKEEVLSKGRGRGGMQQNKPQGKGRGGGGPGRGGGAGRGVFGGRGRGMSGTGRGGQQDKKPGKQQA
ncbi:U6 snRNA-associated Sm-like protein LSm4 isoform X1 [Xyrauchen texanus]|uniref:U6 snRNA-associated Sm-like protein LSm4 isoform X1 n=2 Tax=Xyrauchen texanus TaxID=154827 RepID=UPI002242A08C|nr:U6 snRNA-associated Sm-like protein LSm4 isoform X1 [Xyrauchen texanus]